MSSFDMSPHEDANPTINYRSLEELVNEEDFDVSSIQMWCEKLTNVSFFKFYFELFNKRFPKCLIKK